MYNTITSFKSQHIKGTIYAPYDKSISHRAVILASIAKGTSKIKNILESEDVKATINCFKQLGVSFTKHNEYYLINSQGFANFYIKDNTTLSMGNSGTSCRLLIGLLCGMWQKANLKIVGDESLSKRPMKRVIEPLKLMGASIEAHNDNLLPIILQTKELNAINYTVSVASAQVKSAIMLAALFAKGETTIIENKETRDHSEVMLNAIGVNIIVNKKNETKTIVINNKQQALESFNATVPGDFSSASFFIALAIITKNSEILIKDVNLNYYRTGLLEVLLSMGANIEIVNEKNIGFERAGDLLVKSSNMLQPTVVSSDMVARMIDEFPILAVICSFADGESTFYGVEELRYKESDRISSIVTNLRIMGVEVHEEKDSIKILGNNGYKKGGVLESFSDHRIAMAFLIMGSMCSEPTIMNNTKNIATSYPNFYDTCVSLGLNIVQTN